MKNDRSVSGFNNEKSKTNDYDLVCLSHLRWNFVYQRPQHLLSRFAKQRRVFFFEEPVFSDQATRLEITPREDNLFIVVPRISYADKETKNLEDIQREMLDQLFGERQIKNFVLWFYTPMAFGFASYLAPRATVYDCMDELSAFKFAPPELLANEERLYKKADWFLPAGKVFTKRKKRDTKEFTLFLRALTRRIFGKRETLSQNPPTKNQSRVRNSVIAA